MIVGVPLTTSLSPLVHLYVEVSVVSASYEHIPLYGSDKTTERKTYYWSPPSMEEVKGHSKEKYHY